MALQTKFIRELVKTKRVKNKHAAHKGFTIIETLVVLAIVGLIMLVVFLAIPALQRNSRNRQRDSDARMIAAAIRECLNLNLNRSEHCDDASDIPVDVSTLSIFTGVHYGATAAIPPASVPPTPEEPNWLFNLRCTPDGTWFLPDNSKRAFVVTYVRETGSGFVNRCIDG